LTGKVDAPTPFDLGGPQFVLCFFGLTFTSWLKTKSSEFVDYCLCEHHPGSMRLCHDSFCGTLGCCWGSYTCKRER